MWIKTSGGQIKEIKKKLFLFKLNGLSLLLDASKRPEFRFKQRQDLDPCRRRGASGDLWEPGTGWIISPSLMTTGEQIKTSHSLLRVK